MEFQAFSKKQKVEGRWKDPFKIGLSHSLCTVHMHVYQFEPKLPATFVFIHTYIDTYIHTYVHVCTCGAVWHFRLGSEYIASKDPKSPPAKIIVH